ncbi:MAG: ABC transporter ATP-binding protein [Immundisolibacterales bacterium]|nr:ABC transporter ATP-binding protein [Immundisolibacterales bacterium]
MTGASLGDVILEVEHLETHLDTKMGLVKAVDGVSFSLRRGETLGIVGESGSGKSMTALSILRLAPRPAARIVGGRVLLDGKDLLRHGAEEMRRVRGRFISMVLQDPQTSLNPVYTIGGQIAEAIAMHRDVPRPELLSRAVAALRRVRVAAPEQRVRDHPHQLSGGMKQRVVGAIASSCEPRVLIADEPTTALDATIQAQYLRLLKDIQRESGLSIIFITHDFGIVADMCDQVAVMYGGRIVEYGPVRAIFNTPAHPYTQALLSSVPAVDRTVERLYSIPGQPPSLWDLPPGCRFEPRCRWAEPRCRREYPPVLPGRGAGDAAHSASCWKLEDPEWDNPRC